MVVPYFLQCYGNLQFFLCIESSGTCYCSFMSLNTYDLEFLLGLPHSDFGVFTFSLVQVFSYILFGIGTMWFAHLF